MLTRILNRYLDFLEWIERAERYLPWLGSASSMAKWEQIERMGRRRFILTMGLGLFGTMTLALFLILQIFRGGPFPEPFAPGFLLYAVVFWLVAGYVWGALMWFTMTRLSARKRRRATPAQEAS